MARQELESAMADLGLTIKSRFVPLSQSRHAGDKYRSLNWRVTVCVGTRELFTTDYSAGEAHCPAYKQRLTVRDKYANSRMIDHETEKGTTARYMPSLDHISAGAAILPDPCDVVSSLVLDASALDSATYEDWASEYGYDEDSRKGEQIYRQCLETALRLRAALGDSGLNRLRDAAQDY